MAFSGTISQTVFNTGRIIDNAIRRCKLSAQQITAEYIDIANDQLYLLLSDLANQTPDVFRIDQTKADKVGKALGVLTALRDQRDKYQHDFDALRQDEATAKQDLLVVEGTNPATVIESPTT